VNPNRAGTTGSVKGDADGTGDTIYLATRSVGNMVSWINSNFAGWGSGITVPGYGSSSTTEAACFTARSRSPNVIAGNKRPYNTLSAVLVTQNAGRWLSPGSTAANQQGQGNMQVLVNIWISGPTCRPPATWRASATTR